MQKMSTDTVAVAQVGKNETRPGAVEVELEEEGHSERGMEGTEEH